jgi:hypothetical protein
MGQTTGMRLSTISIDSQALAPPQWSAEWVMRRLVEAYAIERRLPLARRHMVVSAWPRTVTEFADVVGRADDDRKARFAAWEYAGELGVSANAITRQEEAHDWLAIILGPYPEERLCLMQWAAATAYRRSVRRMLMKRGWSRSTFLRRVTAGAHVIAVELSRQGIPVV